MKKFFSFVCALVLVLSATAAPQFAVKKQALPVTKADMVAAFKAAPAVKAPKARVARVVANQAVSGITFAECVYYQSSGMWELDAFDADTNLVSAFIFINNQSNKIAGTYVADANKTAAVQHIPAAGDTVLLQGTFSIAYVSEGVNNPMYHLSATGLVDTLSRSFDFDFTVEIAAFNIEVYNNYYQAYQYALYYYQQYMTTQSEDDYNAFMYYYQLMQQYGSEVDIDLLDAPVVVTGDTIRISIDDLKYSDQMAAYGWWEMYGYNADSSLYVILSNLTDTNRVAAEGVYTIEQMDPEYTYLYVDSIATQITFRDGVVILSQNPDGSHHVLDTLLGIDGNVYIMNLNSKVVVPSTMEFNFQVTDSSVIVTPTENDPWASYIVSAEELVETWNNNIESLAEVAYNYYGDNYNQTGEHEITFAELLESNYIGEYVLVVWGSNGGVTTAPDSIRFVVPVPVSENVITLSCVNDTVNVNTTNDDSYFFIIETKADYDSYQSDYTQASINKEADEWIEYLAGEGYMSYYTAAGDMNVSVADYLGEDATTGDYVALVAPVLNSSVRNGDASYLLFHYLKIASSFMLTDNLNWGTAYVYAWDANGGEPYGAWPGTLVTETVVNNMQETQFVIGVPDVAVGIVVNNGSGAQTVDITDFNYEGYWMDGTQDGQGHYNVIGYGEHSTAVQNVEAAGKVVKALRNGQLIIRKNGVEFDVIGARLK